jgi:sec-independent protein translocase protein TatA
MIVIVVVLLLFGRNKISDLMGDVAGGIKAFKKGMAEDDTAPKDAKDAKTIDHKAQGPAQGPAPSATTASAADAKARADS